MKIIILGAGQVGGTLAEHLASEANDITVVDTDGERLRDLGDRLEELGLAWVAVRYILQKLFCRRVFHRFHSGLETGCTKTGIIYQGVHQFGSIGADS